MSENRNFSAGSMLFSFILGGIVGAGIALLLAPQSGKETREKIKGMAEDIEEKAADYTKQVKEKVTSAVEQGKEFFEDKKSLLTTAIDAGKEAYEKEKEKRTR